MEQDFTKGLNVCIGNYGYYNEGSLHDAWITLPKTEAEIRDFLHLNHLQDPQHEEIYISAFLCKILPPLIKKEAPIAGCPKEKSARKINQRALASGS